MSTHTRARWWKETTPGARETRRHCLEERMIEAASRVIPDVRERILLQRSATPETFERYTWRPGGYVGGIVQRPLRTILCAPNRRVDDRLVLTGDHMFPGQGTVGVALSGINAYRDIVEDLGGTPLL
jgi:phytoene dehydrogenase-like protein